MQQRSEQKSTNILYRFLSRIALLYFLITTGFLISLHYLLSWFTKIGINKLDIHLLESFFLLVFTTLFVYILARYILTSQRLLTSIFFANAAPIVTSEFNLLEKLITTVDEGIVLSDRNNNIISVNQAFTEIMGYSSDEIIGKPGSFLRSGRHGEAFYDELWRAMKSRGIWQGEMWVRRKNGEVFPEWLTYSAVKDAKGDIINYLAIFSDISKRNAPERVEYLVRFDPLTNLPNRAKILDSLAMDLENARHNNKKVALLYINLDFLKKINETYGFIVGDKLLQVIANKLKLHSRENEIVGRLGGDEFMIVASAETNEEIIHLGQRTSEIIQESIIIDGKKYAITPSIGISVYPADGDNAEMLIKDAAMAMQKSKEKGRNNFQFFTHDMNTAAVQYQKMESQLRHALERKEFELYYHPMIDLKTNEIYSAEALMRWQPYGSSPISPEKFIHVAEESGLIIPITDWLMRTACEENLKWQAAGFKIPVSLNISTIDFRQKNFKNRVVEILNETHLDPSNLKFEITEHLMMTDSEETINTLLALKEMNIHLSIDDFGTGYSSLNYLKHLPIDALKIDQSFIHDLVNNQDDQAIVRAIINMAKSLELIVVAEGVENKKQLEFLREQQCDVIQGYYFSKPLTSEEFISFVKEKKYLS